MSEKKKEDHKSSTTHGKRSNQTGNTVGVENGLMLLFSDGAGTVLHCAVLCCAVLRIAHWHVLRQIFRRPETRRKRTDRRDI